MIRIECYFAPEALQFQIVASTIHLFSNTEWRKQAGETEEGEEHINEGGNEFSLCAALFGLLTAANEVTVAAAWH